MNRYYNDDLISIEWEINNCALCTLSRTRNKTVPGEGPSDAKIMIIGEGPGEENDKIGRPFVGRGGKLLDNFLKEAKLCRQELFLTNIIKCRMPHNDTPTTAISSTCISYLYRQIEVINPKIIVTLGLPAAKILLADSKLKLSDAQDKIYNIDGRTILCTYHPSSIRYNVDGKEKIISTLIKARELDLTGV